MSSPNYPAISLTPSFSPEHSMHVEFADKPHQQTKQTTEAKIRVEPIDTSANTVGNGTLITLAVVALVGIYGAIVDQRDRRK